MMRATHVTAPGDDVASVVQIENATQIARQQLAEQLHDVVVQPLTALCIGLQTAQQHDQTLRLLENQVQTWNELAHEALQGLRTLLAGLRGHPHLSVSLPDALARHIAPQLRSQGIQCAIYATDWPEKVPLDVTTGLYLTIREALTNVQKHARASEVIVTLRGRKQSLHVLILDDGVGFTMDPPRHSAHEREGYGFGIGGMASRIRRLGGELQIASSIGHGTQIELMVPLEDLLVAIPALETAEEDDRETLTVAAAPDIRPTDMAAGGDSVGGVAARARVAIGADCVPPDKVAGQALHAIRVAIVDDQPLLRDGLAALLRDEPRLEVVACGSNGHEAIEIAATYHPDIILLDLRMPDMDGMQAIRELKGRFGQMRIAILTSFAHDGYVLEGLTIGADGYLLKDAAPATLIAAIITIASGGQVIDPGIGRQVVEMLARPRATRAASYDGLTPREVQMLTMLASGRVAKEVAHELHLSEKTVRNHVYNIYRKLEIADRSQLVMYAVKKGLVPVT